MNPIRMLDLEREFALYGEPLRAAVERVLTSGRYVGGPSVEQLEQALCSRLGVEHAVAVSSGTDALVASLMALGTGPGDEVIVPALTFFATAGAVARLGARPVFADIDPGTFNIEPESIEPLISGRTKAVIAVDLYGQCAEMDEIEAAARRHGLRVIEDAAQAIGASLNGRPAGTFVDLACLSFYPTKNLGGIGEGGMVLTGDGGLADLIRRLRNQGQSERYVHEHVGGNFRLDALKAAALRVKLDYLDELNRRRRRNAELYDRLLAGSAVTPPFAGARHEPVYHQYSILCDGREGLMAFLQEHGIETAVHYPIPLHLQPCFAYLGYQPGALPVAEQVCKRILALPCHPLLSEEEIGFVAARINNYFEAASARGGAVPAANKV